MKKRESNFELMRILMMCTIPVYHLMVYNGVYFLDNTNAVLALVLSVGGAIPADYAFMALSVYFMLESKNRPVLKRFLFLGAQVLTLYVIKVVTLRGLFGYHNTEYFIDFFLMKGAWWYIYPYLLLSLVYPFLNRLIYSMKKSALYGVTGALFVVFCYQGLRNQGNFFWDCIAFLFTYFFFGMLKRNGYRNFLFLPVKKKAMGFLVCLLYGVMLFATVAAKMQYFGNSPAEADALIRLVIGRYHLPAALMGYALFFFFRDWKLSYHKKINTLAKTTMYVFLLHDTWMGVFWYFGRCANDYGTYSTTAFLVWMILYLVSVFLVAAVLAVLYSRWIEPLWRRLIERCCGCSVYRKLEGIYMNNDKKQEQRD